MSLTRRGMLRGGLVGALGLAVAPGSLLLPAYAMPTPQSGDEDAYGGYLNEPPAVAGDAPADGEPTEDNILGPFYRKGAPFRAKISPPLPEGVTLIVQGRVWGFDTKKPLTDARIDIWQADASGRYDNDDPRNPPAKDVFHYRARLGVDEAGGYEYETVLPGRYKIGRDTWRPRHIHYRVQCAGYKTLVTQLYFKDDPHNEKDAFIKPSLIIAPETLKAPGGEYQQGVFNIILAPE